MKRILRVAIDNDVCLGHWCCQVAPRVFQDVGKPWPVLPDNVEQLLDSDRDQVIEAVVACPIAALSLEFEDGRTTDAHAYDPLKGVAPWLAY